MTEGREKEDQGEFPIRTPCRRGKQKGMMDGDFNPCQMGAGVCVQRLVGSAVPSLPRDLGMSLVRREAVNG